MDTSAPSTGERLRSAPVLEVFASIQGEGLHAGRPQTFLRLAGCPLRCRWCDTEYAFYEGREMSVEEVIRRVENGAPGARRVRPWPARAC